MRFLHTIAIAGVGVFIAVCGAAQFLRTDLDWIAAPLSFYLIGPGGAVVKVAYVALSSALIALGIGFHRALVPGARRVLPMLLFAVSAIALTVTALTQVPSADDPRGLFAFIHAVAAMTTFLCVTVAMLLQSWHLRSDPRWRDARVFAFAMALAAFAALWTYALVHALPRGLAQKTVIALILVWLAWAAIALRRRSSQRLHQSL